MSIFMTVIPVTTCTDIIIILTISKLSHLGRHQFQTALYAK